MTVVNVIKAYSLTSGNAIENEAHFVVQAIHFFNCKNQLVSKKRNNQKIRI